MARLKESGFKRKRVKKRTSIGSSKFSKPKNKNAKKQAKKYRGQGR